jgi:putative membrane protein
MRHFFLRWLFLAIAIAITSSVMPGFHIHGNFWGNLIIISAVLGLINAFIRPIVMLFTCPLIILTLGLFTLIVNGLMLSLTAWLLPNMMTLDGFWVTFFSALIISIISGLLGILLHDDHKASSQ